MGMFNSIFADLRCPVKQDVATKSEIQIKWQSKRALALNVYHLGDILEDIEAEYDNTWIKTDYICAVCSKQTTGKNAIKFIKTNDQQRHPVFVRIADGKITQICTETEFMALNVTDFVNYL
jgi:hypothetical protein